MRLTTTRTGLLGALVGMIAAGPLPASDSRESLRTWEIVRRDCRTAISRQEVTLFGNGTLRLKTRDQDRDEMQLAELLPEEVEAFIRRLEAEDLSEVPEGREEVLGELVERCGLFLDLPDREPARYFFGRFDSLPLDLARVNAIVDDLFDDVAALAPQGGLPRDYFPEPGDILMGIEGQRFKVVALTSDKKGVELLGMDQPLTIFVALESLRDRFDSLIERRDFP